jgi:hypothetical protein
MSQVVEEGELKLTFPNDTAVERLDRQNCSNWPPNGLCFVDFAVEEADRVLLLEIKDPSDSHARGPKAAGYLQPASWKAIVCDELVPKARDSYTYMHLMERDAKEFAYVVLIGAERLPSDGSELEPLRELLAARLRRETTEPWKRPYVADCVVATVETWQRHFPDYVLTRVSGDEA